MANTPLNRSFGDMVREARLEKDIGLRELAKRLDITPSYLSDIENDRRVPAEQVLSNLSRHLDLDFDDLMARAGRLGDEAVRYMSRTPAAGVLFRKLSENNAPEQLIAELTKMVDERTKKKAK